MKRFLKTMLALLLVLALAVPAWATTPTESNVYYAQLSDLAKSIYDAMDAPAGIQSVQNGTNLTITFNGPFSDAQQTANAIADAESKALGAFEQEHLELFWIKGASATISGNSASLTLTISWTIAPNWTQGGRSIAQDSAAVTAAVQALAAEASVQGGPYEQLLYVHDWLTQHNEYNRAAVQAGADYDYLPWTPLAALTDAGQPVCEGYAKAFQLVCEELGYPCILVCGWGNGEKHAWNYVMLKDQWYAVDVTYDDPMVNGASGNCSGFEKREYFLVGADTFFVKHQTGGRYISDVDFDVPALAAQAATPEGVSWLPPDNPNPAPPDNPNPTTPPDNPVNPGSTGFADVDANAYYADAVDWAVGRGVTNGTGKNAQGEDLFSPGATVTRGQAVTFLWRAMGKPEPETMANPFRDVAPGSYYEKAVLWAVEEEITNGYGDGRFGPDDKVTRGQMLVFLWRTMGRYGETEPYDGKPWYEDAEAWAEESECVYGTDIPYTTGAECPRGDVVYYLWNAFLWKLSIAG